MISTEVLEQKFTELISQWGIAEKLNMSPVAVRQLRFRAKRKRNIRIETKLRLMQRLGHRAEFAEFSQKDAAELLKFYIDSSQATKDLGIEYVIEKFKMSKQPLAQLSFQF